jgi:MFS superfamily sulfate permease-like transporter
MNNNPFKNLKADLPASIVVFFVALPLCLGIALASGAPLFSGIISGIIGGIIVGALSGSKIGVSGPAAGLAAIVLVAIQSLGFEDFLVAVVLAGVFQLVLGALRAGVIGYYFPASVIKGMLTGIGIIIFLKQIPFFFGHLDAKSKGFGLLDFLTSLDKIETSSIVIGVIGLLILLLWDSVLSKKGKIFNVIQGPIVAVAIGIIYYYFTKDGSLEIASQNIVKVPTPSNSEEFFCAICLS